MSARLEIVAAGMDNQGALPSSTRIKGSPVAGATYLSNPERGLLFFRTQ